MEAQGKMGIRLCEGKSQVGEKGGWGLNLRHCDWVGRGVGKKEDGRKANSCRGLGQG